MIYENDISDGAYSSDSYASYRSLKAIRDFLIPFEDSGERERDFLSSLSAMKDALLRLQVKQREGNQTEGVLSGMNKCLFFFSIKR